MIYSGILLIYSDFRLSLVRILLELGVTNREGLSIHTLVSQGWAFNDTAFALTSVRRGQVLSLPMSLDYGPAAPHMFSGLRTPEKPRQPVITLFKICQTFSLGETAQDKTKQNMYLNMALANGLRA